MKKMNCAEFFYGHLGLKAGDFLVSMDGYMGQHPEILQHFHNTGKIIIDGIEITDPENRYIEYGHPPIIPGRINRSG